MNMEQKLTVQQALEQGYKYYVYGDVNEWSPALRIEGEGFIQWERGPMLTGKEPSMHPGIDKDSIAELIAENIACNWSDESGDDTDEVYDIVKALDYTAVADMINAALSEKKIRAYEVTDIKLIKE